MDTCAWCKKEEISVYARSEHKEAICSDCEYKYRYAFQQKMFVGKVADLSKEQRREISAYLNNISRFVSAIRSVKREELAGNFKLASNCFGWLLFLIVILLVGFSSKWSESSNGFIQLLVFVGIQVYAIFAMLLLQRVQWLLKFFQLWRKIEKMGISL